ncbi:MAG: hypothetical protein AAFR11_03730 [Pseudomonadota bacterium]
MKQIFLSAAAASVIGVSLVLPASAAANIAVAAATTIPVSVTNTDRRPTEVYLVFDQDTLRVPEEEDQDDDGYPEFFITFEDLNDLKNTRSGVAFIGYPGEPGLVPAPFTLSNGEITIDAGATVPQDMMPDTGLSGLPSYVRGAPGYRPAPSRGPTTSISIGGGAVGGYDFAPLGSGVVITPEGESFGATTDDTFTEPAISIGGGYYSPTLGGIDIKATFASGDETISSFIEPGTETTGNVNIGFNPNTDTTGIIYGQSGLDITGSSEVDFFAIGGFYTPVDSLQLPCGVRWGVGVEYVRFEQDAEFFQQPPAFAGDITDHRRFEFQNTYYDIYVETKKPYEFAGGFSAGPLAAVGLTINETRFDAWQSFTCLICPPEDTFDLAISESETNVTWNADLGGFAEYRYDLSDQFDLPGAVVGFFDGRYEFVGDMGEAFVPRTGDDLFIRNQTAGIEDGGVGGRWRVQIGARYEF